MVMEVVAGVVGLRNEPYYNELAESATTRDPAETAGNPNDCRTDWGEFYGPSSPGTLGWLIDNLRVHPRSAFHKLRHEVRIRQGYTLRRITNQFGAKRLADIDADTILEMYDLWSDGGSKVASGHALAAQLRAIMKFGKVYLKDKDCLRIKSDLSDMRFAMPKARTVCLTAAQAEAVCRMAHLMAHPSIALAQAFQFDGVLRQRDVIGEIVPLSEPGIGIPHRHGMKWMRGLIWPEIDENLILRHVTSKKEKPVEIDLRLAPLVMRELSILAQMDPGKKSGAIIICETTGRPWLAGEFRRKWRLIARAAGVPDNVRNMDSRSGAITEAFEAGADPDQIRKSATHSNLSTTQIYNRGSQLRSSTSVMEKRIASRQARTAQ